MTKQKELLIVVDVQNGFVNDRSAYVVEPIKKFINKWASSGKPIVLTRFINDPGSAWERLIHWTRLRTSPEVDLHPLIQKVIEDKNNVWVFDKRTYSSLTPKLIDLLNKYSIGKVFVCGIATDGCVLKTAVDLFEAGQTPIVLKDLCASHAGKDIHEAGLLLISRFIGSEQVMNSDKVV